jgi:hypothetical protein
MKLRHLYKYYTYDFLKRLIVKQFGENPLASINTILGSEIMQCALEQNSQTSIQIELSTRMAEMSPLTFQPIYLRMYYIQMVSFVDAQRQMGIDKKEAISNFLQYAETKPDEVNIFQAIKMYDRAKIK